MRALERPQPDAAGGAEPIRRALQRRTERKERALEAFLDGDLAGGDMRRMVERYEEEMKQLQEQLERLEQQGADAEETGAERRARWRSWRSGSWRARTRSWTRRSGASRFIRSSFSLR